MRSSSLLLGSAVLGLPPVPAPPGADLGTIVELVTTVRSSGTFANVEDDPIAPRVDFPSAMADVRFIKLVSKREVQGRAWASCAELSVLGQ